MGMPLQYLLGYVGEGVDMLNRIVSGVESREHHYQPQSKSALAQWKYSSSPSTERFKVTPSAGKIMLTVFWDFRGVLLSNFQKRCENTNSASYCEILLKLRCEVSRKYLGKQDRELSLHHENAKPYTARATKERIQELQLELLEHPPYRPVLAPSGFHLFGPPKSHFGSEVSLMAKTLNGGSEVVQTSVKNFYPVGFDPLVKRWDKYINFGREYIEK
jgi:hypothetical protein